MGLKDRLFGNRDKLNQLEKSVRDLEVSATSVGNSLRGKPQALKKACPVCEAPNPKDAATCWQCKALF